MAARASNPTEHTKYEYVFDKDIAEQVGVIKSTNSDMKQVATNNNRGYQMGTVNPLFHEWVKGYVNNLPIMDIGCAFGINTFSAAYGENIPNVIAVDMADIHLKYVDAYQQQQQQQSRNVKVDTILSQLPLLEGVNENSVSSILCGEVIHFLKGDELPIAFKRFYDVLCTNGTLCVTCGSTNAFSHSVPYIRELILERKLQNHPYPGYLDGELFQECVKKTHDYRKKHGQVISEDVAKVSDAPFLHLFTVTQIAGFAEEAGFQVKFIRQCEHAGYPNVIKNSLANIQMVAIKVDPSNE